MVGIPRITFHTWVHQSKGKGGASYTSANGLIKIKKAQPSISMASLPAYKSILVDHYGTKIEMTDEIDVSGSLPPNGTAPSDTDQVLR